MGSKLQSTRGLYCEKLVLRKLRDQGFHLVKQRTRITGIEVDLLMQNDEQEWLLVEVKSVSTDEWLPIRLKARQKKRLVRALLWFHENCSPQARLVLAMVDGEDEVTFFDDL